MSDRAAVLADLRASYPKLKIREGKADRELTPEEYDSRLGEMADAVMEQRTATNQEEQQTTAARAIIARLRNNTATNDDRNRAILFILRYIRSDL